jgi:uncharacterized protein YjbI with pentapeptide repeats
VNTKHLEIVRLGAGHLKKWREENQSSTLDLSRANLSRLTLRGVDFSGADLRGANLYDTHLYDANLRGADLRDSNLSFAHLSGADFTGALLCGATLVGASMADNSGKGPVFAAADLRNVRFTQAGDDVPLIGGFLELACAEGLETAIWGDERGLTEYIEQAFTYAHRDDLAERDRWPKLVSTAVGRIKALQELYLSDDIPSDLVTTVGAVTEELISYLAKHPEALDSVRPRQFEELVAGILASYGWEVQLTPESRDGGYDIFAISKDISGARTSWIIECKRYRRDRKVGVEIARALYGVKQDIRVANAMLATTSDFTRGVNDFKASRYDFDLKNYQDVLNWINTYKRESDEGLFLRDDRLVLPEDPIG